jgi:hypothetical protein
MPHTELAFRPVHELAADVAARRLSPVDLIDAFLTRIEAQEPKLQAFVEVYAEDARRAARGADEMIRSGHAVGPLHGIPVALKDLIEIEGKACPLRCPAASPMWLPSTCVSWRRRATPFFTSSSTIRTRLSTSTCGPASLPVGTSRPAPTSKRFTSVRA